MSPSSPAFARDTTTARYYEQRSEYDEWHESQGTVAARQRPEVERSSAAKQRRNNGSSDRDEVDQVAEAGEIVRVAGQER